MSLCYMYVATSKFELIPTNIFRVRAILRKQKNSEKYPRLYSPWFKKMAKKSPQIFITFSDVY